MRNLKLKRIKQMRCWNESRQLTLKIVKYFMEMTNLGKNDY